MNAHSTTETETVTIWTVYQKPRDYPNYFVLRPWRIRNGQHEPGPCELFDTLEELRSRLPRGLHNLKRFQFDDPTILESWA